MYTVEGNAGAAVSARQYPRTSTVIVGYASMEFCMRRWDKEYRRRLREQMSENRAAMIADGRSKTRNRLIAKTQVD